MPRYPKIQCCLYKVGFLTTAYSQIYNGAITNYVVPGPKVVSLP